MLYWAKQKDGYHNQQILCFNLDYKCINEYLLHTTFNNTVIPL